mgnify:FL=1
MKEKIGIIGGGIIGKELIRKLYKKGYRIPFVVRSSGVYDDSDRRIDALENYENHFSKVDALCLAIPTRDDGSKALEYILASLAHNKPIAICEKGALSNYFDVLKNSLDRIGYSATVGGGTRLLRWAQERMNPDVMEIHAILNGTLNYVFSQLSQERTLGEVVDEAKKLGYAEPGADSHLAVIKTEANRDIPMKTAILFNMLGLGEIRARNIKTKPIREVCLQKLIKQAKQRRYIVSITRKILDDDIIGGFNYESNGWFISAGFKRVDENPLFSRLRVNGVNNALLFYEGKDGENGTYVLSGQGAGASPTCSSMIKDLENLLKK